MFFASNMGGRLLESNNFSLPCRIRFKLRQHYRSILVFTVPFLSMLRAISQDDCSTWVLAGFAVNFGRSVFLS